MKRFFTLCMALLFAGSAFAQEVKQEEKKGPEFKYSANAWVYGASGSQSDYEYDYAHVRVRPLFSLGNENIKIVTQLEIDQDFGRSSSSKDYAVYDSTDTATGDYITISDDSASADPGTDNKVVEVKHAYIDAKDVIIPNLSLMGGLNGYKFPLVVDNDFALFKAGYNFGMGQINLSYIKIDEYDTASNTETDDELDDDATAYAFDLPIKFNGITVRPGVIYIKGGEQSSTFSETKLTNYALNVSADFGMVTFGATGAYMTGDLNSTKETSAYGFDLGLDIKPVEGVKIGAFFTYGTGNDGSDATEDNSYFYNLNKVFGKTSNKSGAPDGRLFLLENATVTSSAYNDFDSMDNALGYMSYGINAQANFDKIVLFAQFGMASTVEDNAAGDSGIGSEIDLKASYEIAPKSTIFVEYGYFMAGDDMGVGLYTKAENASQVAFGMTASI